MENNGFGRIDPNKSRLLKRATGSSTFMQHTVEAVIIRAHYLGEAVCLLIEKTFCHIDILLEYF